MAWWATTATRESVTATSVEVRSTALDAGPLAEHGAGAVLGQPLAGLVHPDHAVEDQEDVGPPLPLAHQGVAGGQLAVPGLGPLPHQLGRQGPLEGALHRGHEGRGVLVAPRGVPAERLAVPVLEVGEPRLGRQVAVAVVEPVPREPAGPEDLELRWAVGVEGQAQGGPDQGGLPLDERLAADPAGGGESGASPGRLDEPHPAGAPPRAAAG